MRVIAGPVVEREQLDLTVGLQVHWFSRHMHPEGMRVTQEGCRYHLSDKWETQGVRLYTRSVPRLTSWADVFRVEFSERLYQVAPGFLATTASLRVNNHEFGRRPVHFYVRQANGFPTGNVVWDDPFNEGASWMLTVETLEVTRS